MSYEIYTVCFLLIALLPVFGFRDTIRMSHLNSVPSSEREIKYQELLSKAGTIGGGIAAGFLYKARVAGAVGDFGDRLGSFDSSIYKPGIKTNDIYYPKWFQGSWKSCSIFDAIEAPLGIDVIGGKTVYQVIRLSRMNIYEYLTLLLMSMCSFLVTNNRRLKTTSTANCAIHQNLLLKVN
jgi:hypothetical protein